MRKATFLLTSIFFLIAWLSIKVDADTITIRSASGPDPASINPTYSTIFQPFSPLRVFAVIGSNVMDVTFSVPGSPNIPALTNGFGAVFTDVDLVNTTSLEFFDINDVSRQFFCPDCQ